MKQSMRLVFNNKINKNGYVTIFFQFILIFFSMPLYAELNYLFPSDIINQPGLDNFNVQRINRYTSQPEWVYLNEIKKIDQTRVQPNYDSYRQAEPKRYNYSDYPSSQPFNYPLVNTNPGNISHALGDRISGQYNAATGKNSLYYGNHINAPSRTLKTMTSPVNTGEQYKKYPNLLYVTDLEPDRRVIIQKKNTILNEFSNHDEHPQAGLQNSYIPVPGYNISRINSAASYNLLTGFGIFPQL